MALAAPQLSDNPLPTTEDGDPIISLVDPPDEKKLPPYDPMAPNLVEIFTGTEEGKEALEEVADTVIREFDADWDGAAKSRETRKRINMLFAGELPPKEGVYKDMANAHVPILLENVQRIIAHIEAEAFGNWKNICSVPPMGDMNQEHAELVEIHQNWQLREQITDFRRQMTACLTGFVNFGECTAISCYDPELRLNRHLYLTPDEFVMPFVMVSRMPDCGDLPHYTQVLRYYRHQLQAMKLKWYGVEELLEQKPSWDDEPEKPIREGQAEIAGEEMPSDLGSDAPYTLLQYEGWLELPQQDRDRWCQVVLDRKSRKLLSLKISEEADWQDRARYESQQQEFMQWQMVQGQHDAMAAQQQAQLAQVGQGAAMVHGLHQSGEMPPDHAMAAAQSLNAMMPPPLPPPPPPPSWLKDDMTGPEPVRMVPIRMYQHGVCFEPISGSQGLGLGGPLSDYNRAANVALSQFTDQAAIGNAKGLIVASTVDFERPFSWAPGKINKVKGVSGSELKNAIMPLDPGAANPQLLQLVQLMQSNGESAAQAPDVLSGESGKSGETYRGIATRIEQATKQLGVVGGRFADFVRGVLRNNARLNAVFLRDEELFEVTQDASKTMQQMKITRDLYQRGYKIEIAADMTFSSKAERVSEADQIAQMVMAFPMLTNNVPFAQMALKCALDARSKREMTAYLGPILPPPTTPFGLPPPGMGPPSMPPPGAPQGGPPPHNAKGPGDGPPPEQGAAPLQNHPQGPGGPAPGPPPPQPAQAQPQQ